MQIQNAFYIRLGKGGEWESSSIRDGLLRFGWSASLLADVNAGAWDKIKQQLRAARYFAQTATRDVNALREIVSSTGEDVWIAFHHSRLWWCRLAPGPVEEDSTSRFRRTAAGWSDSDAAGRTLQIATIPSDISQLQGFRGAVYQVKAADSLRRLLGAETGVSVEVR